MVGTLTNDAKFTFEIKFRIAVTNAAFNKRKILLASKLYLNLRKKLVKCFMWNVALCDAQIWTYKKSLESSEMWSWRRMKKVSRTDRVKNEEVLHRVKEEKSVLHTIRRRKANWIGHILRRHCLLKHVMEGKV